MSNLFLTAGEIEELTGYKASKQQAGWLERNRWRFVLDRHEKPKVARDHFNDRLGTSRGSQVNQFNPALALEQPNFEALNRH